MPFLARSKLSLVAPSYKMYLKKRKGKKKNQVQIILNEYCMNHQNIFVLLFFTYIYSQRRSLLEKKEGKKDLLKAITIRTGGREATWKWLFEQFWEVLQNPTSLQ